MVYATLAPRPVTTLRREIDRLFDDVLRSDSAPARVWSPAVDVRQYSDRMQIDLDLPGVDPSAVEVTVDDGALRIRGERARAASAEATRFAVSERIHGSFERRIPLPELADQDGISASYAAGVLTLTVPLRQLPSPRRIMVESR
jgi:HSP20 family protein